MKKIKKFLFIFCLFWILPLVIQAKQEVNVYLFWGDGCPHCAHETEFLSELEKKDKDLDIEFYEVWEDENNARLMEKIKKSFDLDPTGSVPFTVIGDKYFMGYGEPTAKEIKETIDECHKKGCEDIVSNVISGSDTKVKSENKTDEFFDLPLIGSVNVKETSLALIAMVIGLVDGFNPCAMWILIFLISMLIGMKNRKRMWALGLTFLTTSALVYMLFMVAWLGISLKISQIFVVRVIIAIIALIAGIINIRAFFKANDSGCEVVDEKKRTKIIDKIKKFTHEKSFILAMLGVMALAFTVNLVELACSAGLPLVFTQILALNDLNNFSYMMYILIYIFFFLLDDLVVFMTAMITLKVTGITTKYNKFSHLIGGIIMILIGILLVFKPEWIMFNF